MGGRLFSLLSNGWIPVMEEPRTAPFLSLKSSMSPPPYPSGCDDWGHAVLQNELAKLTMLKSEAQARQAMRDCRIQQMAVESSGELRNVNVSWQ